MAAKNKISSAKTKLVIVESPTKARTIKKFLGDGFIIESCMGHIRDLPQSAKDIPEKYKKFKWSNLGVNVDDNFDPIYCIPKNKTKVVKELKQLLKQHSGYEQTHFKLFKCGTENNLKNNFVLKNELKLLLLLYKWIFKILQSQ